MKAAFLAVSCLVCSSPCSGISDALAFVQSSARAGQQQSPQKKGGPPPFLPTDNPKDGDIFLGQMTCSDHDVGIRLKIDQFPKSTRLEIFPMNWWEPLSRTWCRSFSGCSTVFPLRADPYTLDVENMTQLQSEAFILQPAEGAAAQLAASCSWGEFGLVGTLSEGVFNGDLNGNLAFKEREDLDQYPPGTPWKCRLVEHLNKQNQGGHAFCRSFHLEKCKGEAPRSNEKIVYTVLSTQGDQNAGGKDGILNAFGERQSRNLHMNPALDRVLSQEPGQRAEAVIVSPMARALQTALLALGDYRFRIYLDANLMTKGDQYGWDKEQGERVLMEANATSLLKQYRELWDSINAGGAYNGIMTLGENSERMERFRRTLFSRPEQRFIVVGHRTLYEDLQLPVRGFGGTAEAVEMRVLNGAGKWRETSNPRCWF